MPVACVVSAVATRLFVIANTSILFVILHLGAKSR
jgi:hypothetical protein